MLHDAQIQLVVSIGIGSDSQISTPGLLWGLGAGITYAMYFGSIKELPAQTSALFSYIDPVSAIILSALFLNEHLTLFSGIGAVLVLGSTLLSDLSLPAKKQQ